MKNGPYKDVEIEKLRQSGKIAARVLWEMINMLRPGVTPNYLDEKAARIIHKLNARSAPKLAGFPGYTCISVNDIIAHGIPDKRILRCGDKVNIDVSIEHKGFFGDVAYTLTLGNAGDKASRVIDCAKKATMKAIEHSIVGTPINKVAQIIEQTARDESFTIIKNLCSHGVGKTLHAYPENIANYYDPDTKLTLREGMVIAWEPYISSCAVRAMPLDEWNLTTHNKSMVAQFEHTILITDGKPEILTVL